MAAVADALESPLAPGLQADADLLDADGPPGLSKADVARGFKVLAITTFAMQITMNLFQTISSNFFRDEIGMTGAQNGYLIAIRELPGFLLIFVAAALLRLGLARATAFSLLIAGVGFMVFAPMHSVAWVIVPTLISSVGYHSWLQLQNALGLSLARKGEEGSVLGRFSAIGFAGGMIAMIGVLVALGFVWWWTGDLRANQGPVLRGVWLFAGATAIIGSFMIRRFPTSHDDRAAARLAPRITWRREYRLYYLLSFLDGSRQQIYFAFAPFVLVEHFNLNVFYLTAIQITAAMINWRTGPWIGRLVDVRGEKRVLTMGYCMHLTVFIGFALAPNVWLAAVAYLGYNFLFLFSIGTTTYLKKISRREDLAPSLAMGVSLSHLTAIVVPVFGAALWNQLGYQFPFLFGTLFIFLSLYATQKIDVVRQRIAPADGAATA
ncbi:MAG: MFS transporter [Thermomicrobiales bacterium]